MEKKYYKYKIDLASELSKVGINSYTVKKDNKLSQGTLTKIKRHESLSLNTAAKVCCLLGCQLSDIFEVVDPEENI